MTRKMSNLNSNIITFLPYEKIEGNKDDYSLKELSKAYNIREICERVRSVIRQEEISFVVMEGVAYGSTHSASLVDLSGLNFALRMVIIDMGLRVKIVSPTQVKQWAVGSGNAKKEVMINAWKHCDPRVKDLGVKVDDVADAYFISHMV